MSKKSSDDIGRLLIRLRRRVRNLMYPDTRMSSRSASYNRGLRDAIKVMDRRKKTWRDVVE